MSGDPEHINNHKQALDFVRKTKRRHSPKHKKDIFRSFKCHRHTEGSSHHKNSAQEEYVVSNNFLQKEEDIVLDLKYQLTSLKESIANIAQNPKKNKCAEESLESSNTHRQKIKNLKSNTTKTDYNKEGPKVLKLGSKKNISNSEKIRFARVKNNVQSHQLKSPNKISATDLIEGVNQKSPRYKEQNIKCLPTNPTSTQELPKHEQLKSQRGEETKSPLANQLKKIKRKHELSFDQKLNQLLELDRQSPEKSRNSQSAKKIPFSKLQNSGNQSSNCQKKQEGQRVSIKNESLGNSNGKQSDIKILKYQKKLKQSQIQAERLVSELKVKNQRIQKLQKEIMEIQNKALQRWNQKEVEASSLSRKLSEIIYQKNESEYLINELRENSKEAIKALQKETTSMQRQIVMLSDKLQSRDMDMRKLEAALKDERQLSQSLQKEVKQLSVFLESSRATDDQEKQDLKSKIRELNHRIQTLNHASSERQHTKFQSSELHSFTGHRNYKVNCENSHSTASDELLSSKQRKELQSIIRMHERSIQNYQKDLEFLESQLKALHYLRKLSRSQQTVISDLNGIVLCNEMEALNQKYKNKH